MTFFLSPEAEVELAEAVDFYALNVSARVAGNFLALFEAKAQLLVEFPRIGAPTTRAAPSTGKGAGLKVRAAPYGKSLQLAGGTKPVVLQTGFSTTGASPECREGSLP